MMGHRFAVMFGLAGLICAQLASAQPRDRGSQTEEEERSRLYEEGIKLAEKGNWKDAVVNFRRVVQLRAAPTALFTLAEAEHKLGRLASARRAYSSARVMGIKAGETAVAEASAAAILAIEPSIPRARIRTTGTIARVTLDGDAVDLQDDALEVDPGEHTIAVTLTDGTDHTETLDLRPGDRVDINANPPGASGGGDEAGPAVAGPIVLGALGLAAGIVGVALYVQGQGEYDDSCGAEHICPTQDAVDTGNAARGRMIAGDVMMGVGFAALGGGAIWLGVELGTAKSGNGASGAAFRLGGAF